MGDKNQSKIIKHHKQVDGKRIKQLKEQYAREHRYKETKKAGLILKRQAEIVRDVFYAVYVVCLITSLLSAFIYAMGEIYGF